MLPMALQEGGWILLICSDMYDAVWFTNGACAARGGRERALVVGVRAPQDNFTEQEKTYRRALVTTRVVVEVYRSERESAQSEGPGAESDNGERDNAHSWW